MLTAGMTRRDLLRASVAAAGTAVFPERNVLQGAHPDIPGYLQPPPEAAAIFSKDYGRQRISRVQAAIRAAGLDALIVTNRCLDYISYVCNFHPFPLEPGLALVPVEGQVTLFVNTYSPAHTRALQAMVWTDDLVDVPHDAISEGSNQNLVDFCIQRLRDRKLDRGRIGLAGDEIDWILPYYLNTKLPEAQIVDAGRTLTELIVVKDETELKLIRFAQRYIDEVAYPTFQATLRPGELDHVVYGGVLGNILERGASPSTVLLFDAGPAGAGTWARGPLGKRLQAGDIVLSEPTPSVAGYQSEKMYTFALGRSIPDSQKHGAEVVYEAFNLVMGELKPDRELTLVLEKLDAFMRRHGYDGCTVPVGHWIGTQNHEGPRFTRTGSRGWVLKPNMVMSWHPNVVIPGKVRTTCSTCVVITPEGAKDLSSVKMQPIYYV
jgi:Xaa-Pro aminopeptidase